MSQNPDSSKEGEVDIVFLSLTGHYTTIALPHPILSPPLEKWC